ncbi:MAG: mechanosensitive ion channel domain-containing protein [Halobacteriaceae archaeon]
MGDDLRFLFAFIVLFVGLIAGLVVGRLNRRLLLAVGVDKTAEGTYFERTARSLGTSTVSIFARLSSWLVYGIAIVAALHLARLLDTDVFWLRLTAFVPNIFVAAAVLAAGFVIGDKAELWASERLRGIKLPEVGVLPRTIKYSVVFVAALIAAGQIGVATAALLVLLGAYAFGIVVFAGLALQDLLRAASAGVYLLLQEPYGIGDQVEIGDRHGVVQDITVFVTHVEGEDREYVVPNHAVLRDGAVITA